jgi:hypothetical protein
MKSNRIRFFFLDLDLLFQVISRFEIITIQFLLSDETHGHQHQPIWWPKYVKIVIFSLYAGIWQKFLSP